MPRGDIRPKWDVSTGIPDLSGKVAIVTGANSSVGIGWNVAHQLALHGAKVYVGARSAVKANDAIAEMRNASSGKSLDLRPLVMDLLDFKQVSLCAREFVKKESRLDILVNNAGLLACPLDKDANGISLSFATNHLGPFLFTVELFPLLKKTAASHPGVRVVALSSTMHAIVKSGLEFSSVDELAAKHDGTADNGNPQLYDIKFSSVDDFSVELGGTDDFNSNLRRYGLSKLANVLFTKELQKRFERDNIDAVAVAVHPGTVKTNGAMKYAGGPNSAVFDDALTPLDGALTPLFAATNPAVWAEKDKYKAQYLIPYGAVEEPCEDARNEELAKQLWETSEKVVRQVLSK